MRQRPWRWRPRTLDAPTLDASTLDTPTLEGLTLALCTLSLLSLAFEHRRLMGAARGDGIEPSSAPAAWPALTVIRPVKGTDVEQLENFRAALAMDYPGPLETLFVFEDAEDPAHDVARQAISEHVAGGGHSTARIVLAGPPPAGRTGKISNMVAGMAQASGALIAFGDSDTRPAPDLLRSLVAELLADDRTGAVFALPVSAAPPRTVGDVGYAVILNAYLGAAMRAFAGPSGSLPFLMGQCMLFRRTVIDAFGGIESADGQFVDDMFLGAQVVRAGAANRLATASVAVVNHGLGFAAFWRLWRRWLFFGRGGIPLRFMVPMAVRGLAVFTALGLLTTCLLTGAWLVSLLPAAVVLLEGVHYLRLNRALGGAPVPGRLVWAAWLPQPMALAIALTMLVHPQVEWRGRTYRLDPSARLRPSEPTDTA